MAVTIEEAAESLRQRLGEPDIFTVTPDGGSLRVSVVFIYRVDDVKALGDAWEGYPIKFGRVSCW
jgi:hypothetical protein